MSSRGGAADRPLPLQRVLQRDRAIVLSALGLVIVACWAFLLAGAGMDMDVIAMSGADGDGVSGGGAMAMMIAAPAWGIGHAALMFAMWWVMMLAMMLPSAAPMILLFGALNRKTADGRAAAVAAFVAAYVVAWGGFGFAATGLQWALEAQGLVSGAMRANAAWLGGALLIAAGLWQVTPLKHACLRYCRSPIHFFATGWRAGAGGAFRMGLRHGAFCLGCCWVLMLLLFYGGVMNLWWIAGLALYVLIEKLLPAGHTVGRFAGGLLALWGIAVLALAAV